MIELKTDRFLKSYHLKSFENVLFSATIMSFSMIFSHMIKPRLSNTRLNPISEQQMHFDVAQLPQPPLPLPGRRMVTWKLTKIPSILPNALAKHFETTKGKVLHITIGSAKAFPLLNIKKPKPLCWWFLRPDALHSKEPFARRKTMQCNGEGMRAQAGDCVAGFLPLIICFVLPIFSRI